MIAADQEFFTQHFTLIRSLASRMDLPLRPVDELDKITATVGAYLFSLATHETLASAVGLNDTKNQARYNILLRAAGAKRKRIENNVNDLGTNVLLSNHQLTHCAQLARLLRFQLVQTSHVIETLHEDLYVDDELSGLVHALESELSQL